MGGPVIVRKLEGAVKLFPYFSIGAEFGDAESRHGLVAEHIQGFVVDFGEVSVAVVAFPCEQAVKMVVESQ